jgi:hypothetical protein
MQLGLDSLPQLQQLAALATGVEAGGGGAPQPQENGSNGGSEGDPQAMTAALIQRHLPLILARLLIDDSVKLNVSGLLSCRLRILS